NQMKVKKPTMNAPVVASPPPVVASPPVITSPPIASPALRPHFCPHRRICLLPTPLHSGRTSSHSARSPSPKPLHRRICLLLTPFHSGRTFTAGPKPFPETPSPPDLPPPDAPPLRPKHFTFGPKPFPEAPSPPALPPPDAPSLRSKPFTSGPKPLHIPPKPLTAGQTPPPPASPPPEALHLGIFLFGVGHGVANRILAETFKHSGETISRHFNNVVRGIVGLKDDYIMLPSSNVAVHPRIRDNPNFHPFKNAIGAIDGTHIPVMVKKSKQAPFRCRKGFISQNMMAAVSFDLNFLFVCTGWEGSAADMRVLRWACESGGFIVPEGKYYLVDSGYANTEQFLAPYRGERYHIGQFDASTRARDHRNPRDLYNHRHAQLRNVVERTFGILKKRFKILNVTTPFPYKVQCLIVMACCIIHNFIRRHQANDYIFFEGPNEQDAENEGGEGDLVGVIDDSQNGEDLCANITNQLWNTRI
ncbi:putative nuclease HARBI1, partial [Ananas comosus]